MPVIDSSWRRMLQTGRAFPLIGAHRGLSSRYPENTAAAFYAAIECGADFLEFDVRMSRDGFPVVVHDETLIRTAGLPDAVDTLSAAELARLGQVPRLSEVLSLSHEKIALNIELKAGINLVRAVLAEVRHWGAAETVLFSSFDHGLLAEVRALAPEILIGFLYEEDLPDPVATASAAGAATLHPFYRLADRRLIRRAAERGIAVIPWTVDRVGCWRYIHRAGAVGLITNRADQAASCNISQPQAGKQAPPV